MASIYLLEGKNQLLKIQVPRFVDLHQVFRWGTVLRRTLSVKLSCFALLLTSTVMMLYLLLQLYTQYSSSESRDFTESELIWAPPEVCEDCVVKEPLPLSQLSPGLFLILIHSSAMGRSRRDTIRSTWVSNFKDSEHSPIQYRFVLGGATLRGDATDQILKEAQEHQDMIILYDVTDSRDTLTGRTIKGFKFALREFSFSYVLKCDDDTFVDVRRIASELQLRKNHKRLYWGFMTGNNRVQIYIGPYKEWEWSLCDKYIPYALGGGYLLSRDLIELLVRNEPYLKYYKCEDVSVGAWLAPYNIERRHDSRFDTGSLPRGCKNEFLMSHKVDPEEMFAYYRSLQLEGQYCSWRTQWFYQNGYLYNWTALPSQCCSTQSGIP